jgi:hypothetical protein
MRAAYWFSDPHFLQGTNPVLERFVFCRHIR